MDISERSGHDLVSVVCVLPPADHVGRDGVVTSTSLVSHSCTICTGVTNDPGLLSRAGEQHCTQLHVERGRERGCMDANIGGRDVSGET